MISTVQCIQPNSLISVVEPCPLNSYSVAQSPAVCPVMSRAALLSPKRSGNGMQMELLCDLEKEQENSQHQLLYQMRISAGEKLCLCAPAPSSVSVVSRDLEISMA